MTQPAPSTPTSRLAIVALVTSFLLSPVGLVLGFVALRQIQRSPTPLEGRGLAIGALVVSALGLFAGLFSLVAVFGLLSLW
jgi:uncharacterized membrane protein